MPAASRSRAQPPIHLRATKQKGGLAGHPFETGGHLMIAPAGYASGREGARRPGTMAAVASDTLESFTAVTEMLTSVGNTAVSYGVGHPLVAFQSLLRTYQILLKTQAALATTAQQIIKLVQP